MHNFLFYLQWFLCLYLYKLDDVTAQISLPSPHPLLPGLGLTRSLPNPSLVIGDVRMEKSSWMGTSQMSFLNKQTSALHYKHLTKLVFLP